MLYKNCADGILLRGMKVLLNHKTVLRGRHSKTLSLIYEMCHMACATYVIVVFCVVPNSLGFSLKVLDEREYDVNVAPIPSSNSNTMLHTLRDNLLNFAAFLRLHTQNSKTNSSSSESIQYPENFQHAAAIRLKQESETVPLELYGALSNKFQ